MIILEGPDGAGKSTLVKQLSHDLDLPVAKRACTSTGGPVDDLGSWAARDVSRWRQFPLSLYDRHPFISEYIYGPALRGYLDPTVTALPPLYRQRFMDDSLTVLCMPPLSTVKANLTAEPQMDGVTDRISLIYALYQAYAAQDPRVVIYNYETLGAYRKLHHTILNYIKENAR